MIGISEFKATPLQNIGTISAYLNILPLHPYSAAIEATKNPVVIEEKYWN